MPIIECCQITIKSKGAWMVHKDVKTALVDHISSPAAQLSCMQPDKAIVRVCHERGVKVLVD